MPNGAFKRIGDAALPTGAPGLTEIARKAYLIANAIEAMAYHGTLKVITRAEHDFVMVEIADNGPGIPVGIQPRIFDPFFTTKPVGAGTGLGLDITYRIIKQHNGTIEVQSQPGNTRFIVRLPR